MTMMDKYRLGIILGIVLSNFIPNADGNPATLPEDIILGTVYNFFHAEFPDDEAFFATVDRDIPVIREANLNAVLVWPVSQWDPQTKALRWVRGDYLLDKIEAEGLGLSLLLLAQRVLDLMREQEVPFSQTEGGISMDVTVPAKRAVIVKIIADGDGSG